MCWRGRCHHEERLFKLLSRSALSLCSRFFPLSFSSAVSLLPLRLLSVSCLVTHIQSVDGRKGNSFTVISTAIETRSPPCLYASDSLLCIFFLLQVSQASLLSRPLARAASTSRASLPVSMSVCHLACQSVCPYSCPSLCLFGSHRTATQQKEHYNPHNLLAKCWGSNCHLLS